MKIGAWIFASMGVSLTVTLILELVFAWTWKIRERRELMLVAAANLMTNPAVVAFTIWLPSGFFQAGQKMGRRISACGRLKEFWNWLRYQWKLCLTGSTAGGSAARGCFQFQQTCFPTGRGRFYRN